MEKVQAELRPTDKIAALDKLVERNGNVTMVGDGIIDAPVFGIATVDIAMGGIGSDAAIDTGDFALIGDDVGQLSWPIAHLPRTLSIIRQDIFISLGFKEALVLLTQIGHALPWAAIEADTGASFLLIFNGLRLLRSKL